MKNRSGFVSNSSSSSFIIALPGIPKDETELMDFLYKNDQVKVISDGYSDYTVDIKDATHAIWVAIKDQIPLDGDVILKEINSGYFDGYPEIDYSCRNKESYRIAREYKKKYGTDIYSANNELEEKKQYLAASQKELDDENNQIAEAATNLYLTHKSEFDKKKVYIVSFSDEDGEFYSTLEHGDTFRNITHICVSHH